MLALHAVTLRLWLDVTAPALVTCEDPPQEGRVLIMPGQITFAELLRSPLHTRLPVLYTTPCTVATVASTVTANTCIMTSQSRSFTLSLHFLVLFFCSLTYLDTWKQMEECVRLGLTKSVGVSNFNSKQLARLLEVAKIKPVTNQIECHAYLNQKKLIQFCKEKDIVITAYSPLANPSMKMPEGEVPLMQNPKMKELADKYGKSIAQVLLRYLIQIGTVPIPKSVHKERIKENFNVFDFELNAEDLACIDTFNKNYRVCAFNETKAAIHYPFYEEF
ncbi:aldo-keto reductase family 1 member B7-like [Schistocerca gregaria]|uniref:aldo-keto reductase family 1 member B7-like n=1 Tax=Schistocerca gregaria TaxID=7010 RepID=UPI00211DBBBA|nr:aldo-keto reductase family 1 member B7-like [Schistocerca gregaria]